jgi:hypothetical protein
VGDARGQLADGGQLLGLDEAQIEFVDSALAPAHPSDEHQGRTDAHSPGKKGQDQPDRG